MPCADPGEDGRPLPRPGRRRHLVPPLGREATRRRARFGQRSAVTSRATSLPGSTRRSWSSTTPCGRRDRAVRAGACRELVGSRAPGRQRVPARLRNEVVWRSEAGVHRRPGDRRGRDVVGGPDRRVGAVTADGRLGQGTAGRPRAVALWGGAQMLEVVSSGRSASRRRWNPRDDELRRAFALAAWTTDDAEHGVAIADVAAGDIWTLPTRVLRMVRLVLRRRRRRRTDLDDADAELLACYAVTRSCDSLPTQGGARVLLPS